MVDTSGVEKQVRIIIGPIAALLRSRKFMASFAAVLVSFLIAREPALAPYADVLIIGILLMAAVLTGSIAAEDNAERRAAAVEAAGRTQQENLNEAIRAGIELFYANPPTAQAVPVEIDVASLTRNVAALVTAQLVEQGRPPTPIDNPAG